MNGGVRVHAYVCAGPRMAGMIIILKQILMAFDKVDVCDHPHVCSTWYYTSSIPNVAVVSVKWWYRGTGSEREPRPAAAMLGMIE